jgi:Ca2+/H+ antiporter
MRVFNANNPLNGLPVFVPVAAGLHFDGADDVWVCAASVLAIVPLAGLMGRSTEMLAERTGPGMGGLLNACFGCVGRIRDGWRPAHVSQRLAPVFPFH